MAQLFISYRSSDGRDKATALARDLGALYGDAQVFIDKDDLRAGVQWRDEIAATLKEQPVLLLLLTPQLLGARDDHGKRRIDDPADPVRREVADALAGGAHLIPLLCDGVTAAPPAAELPPPLNRIGEFTWRPLRAYDWEHDIRRLVDDLQALGIAPAAPLEASAPAPATAQRSVGGTRRRWLVAGMAAAAALALGIGGYALRLAPTPSSTDVSGAWSATLSPDETLSLSLRQIGDQVELNSRPVPISQRADWADYRSFWRERFGSELDTVSYRGKGSASALPGEQLVVDIALQIVSTPGDVLVDSGNLHATIAADGTTMAGTVWLNGKQAERPLQLLRLPKAR
jgi:hypothetical protein